HRLGSLALGAHEQDASARSRDISQGNQRLMQERHRLGEVENVNVIARAIDVGRHLGIPALLAVTEMGAGLEQSTHGKFWQSHGFRLLYRLARRAGYPP